MTAPKWPDIDKMSLPELREYRREVRAELAAIVARLQELERVEFGLPASEPNPIPIVGQPGGPNAHSEGAEATEDDGA